MIVYVSDSINSKKNGGSSTSGFEFLQFLRIYYKNVVLITSDHITEQELNAAFYNEKLNSVKDILVIKRKFAILNFTFRSFIRPIYYFFKDIRKKSTVNLKNFYTEGGENILYINSWSAINTPSTLKNTEMFTKVCIVRGSPESFVWQSFETDKDEAVQNAADYLEDFDKLIYVSENGLVAWGKILKKNIESFYLPNSINEYEIQRVNKIFKEDAALTVGFSNEFYNVVVVGSVQKRKAQDILLKIAAHAKELKPTIRFHIVGVISKTWGGDEIYNEIIHSPYADLFVFHGHSDEALLFMQAADLLIFTSHAEAFPRTVAEYMSLGKPILAANVSGVSEMIVDGHNGYLYDPLDSDSLMDAFIKMEDNEENKKRLRENAYETYWTKFSKKNHINRAMNVFAKIK